MRPGCCGRCTPSRRSAWRRRGRAAFDLSRRPEAATLHAFLRECWEALDGLAREVNLVMHALFPAAGLYAPFEMTRQCTFYVVRKLLHDWPRTAAHPVSDLLWSETREDASAAYRRLSYLYNVSLFLPLAPVNGRLPGAEDFPSLRAPWQAPASRDMPARGGFGGDAGLGRGARGRVLSPAGGYGL